MLELSEVLKCLENIEADLTGLPKHITEYDDGFDNYLEDIWNNIDTIKQILQPKQYLKWEDLEFKEEGQKIPVLLNGTKYQMYCCKEYDERIDMFNEDGTSIVHIFAGGYPQDKQLFNDLHLERVEE